MNNIYVLKGKCDPYAFVKEKAAEKYNNTEIVKDEKGKPYFKYIPDLFFNVSNKDSITVIAMSNSKVGVDIEKVKKANLKVIKRFLKEEADYINECDSDRRFFEVWTKKEAYLKCKGSGISGGLDSVNVLNLPIQTVDYEDYVISVCYEKDLLNIKK